MSPGPPGKSALTLLCSLSLLTGAVSGCGLPFASPGLRADLGAAGGREASEFEPRLHLTTGLSLASVLRPHRGPGVDLGAGYVLSAGQTPAALHGGYLDAAYLHGLRGRWRLSGGVRAERLWAPAGWGTAAGHGAALRFALERTRFTRGSFAAGFPRECHEEPAQVRQDDRPREPGEPPRTQTECRQPAWMTGVVHGSSAYGLSLELGRRRLPWGEDAHFASLGLTFRLPAGFGLLFALPEL